MALLRTRTPSALPGLLVTAAGVAVAMLINGLLPMVSALTAAVLLGALLTNAGLLRPAYAPGIRLAARRLLRIGVALLGLKLVFGEVLALGPGVLALVVGAVALTFCGTRWLGSRLGVHPGLSLLVATGFSICGASAVAAMNGVSEQDEREVARALGLVTLFGSLAMIAFPLVEPDLGLTPTGYGIWAGGSLHEVAQVVAAAAPVGGALAIAVAVKLTRVVLLAPLLAVVGYTERRRCTGTHRPPIIPAFVVGFLVMAVIRSLGVLPGGLLDAVSFVDTLLLAAGMFALGSAVRLRELTRSGGPVLLLGLLSTLLIAGITLAGVLILT
ncbi:putative sulfate exporter family transporter [Pseudonocardiaceae bacterium YIM PH 21723]|nr:putative sulfate exporter family transporter [Pseudonocardiaceae bacterium YIM PH 21723]